jgi:adenosylmethionine-8-amino-7-oxononanoate aminotransferase
LRARISALATGWRPDHFDMPVSDFVILGTDTDAGKTTFAALWLAAFSDHYEYWKPLETGEADSQRLRRLVPAAVVHPSVKHFNEAVAPLLAARQQGDIIPTAAELAALRPKPASPRRGVVIETFGSPFSPLNESELQLAFIKKLDLPCVLIASSAVGAIGRTLQCWHSQRLHGLDPAAIVLVGATDLFAVEQIRKHTGNSWVFALTPPEQWTEPGLKTAAEDRRLRLDHIREVLEPARRLPRTENNIVVRDRASVWHPYTSLRDSDAPLVCVGAQDEFLHLADGRRLIDAISSWWTILHGHRDPELMAALARAQEQIDHVQFAGLTHEPAVVLAELLLKSAPWQGGKVFYSDNGSTAVEVALKMAYQFWYHRGEPQRTLFVGFENGYHGDTFGAMAASRDPVFFGTFEPLLFRALIVPLDAQRLDDVLSKHTGQVAAMIVEPLVQGAGGMRMHTADELRALFEVSQKHSVLFIADEVMTGGGRLGTLWAHQQAGIAPDLICAAKTLTGGMLPLAATLVAPHIVAAFETDDRRRTFFHGHSFTAHPMACAVAVANWRQLTQQLPDAPRRFEKFWQQALAPLSENVEVTDVRIRGSIAAVEVPAEGGYLAEIGRRMRHRCLEHGVFLRPLGNVLYAMPPFCTSDESLARITEATIEAVSK